MKKWLIGGAVLGTLVLTAAVAVTVYASRQTVPHGVSVSGWQAGGVTLADFREKLEGASLLLAHQKVLLTAQPYGAESATLSLEQLGLQSNAAEIVAQLAPLDKGSLASRARARWRLSGRAFELQGTFAADRLKQTVDSTWSALQRTEPVNAQRTVTPKDELKIVPGKNAYRIDVETLRGRLDALFPRKHWTLGLLEPPLTVSLPLQVLEPKVTEKSLQAQGITRKIGEYATTFPASGEGRMYNIESTAKTVNDRLMAPGDIFDYSKIVQETEQTCGFREAPVILNGKLVPGVGGGICQVSSTLYNAVLRSGLEIVERRNHSLPVSYVEPGLDATYAEGYINFKFRNNTDHFLLIRTAIEGGKLNVKLFGQTPPDTTYEVITKTVKELPPPNKYVSNPSLGKGKQVTLQQGKPGVVVETYRIKKQNGNVVSTEQISRDSYAPQPTLIAINGDGTKLPEDASPNTPIIEDGVRR